ncbi:hypothetical protein PVK06_004506 [Gossypium arboreum]|uniref:Uncharacterized protein n=1 Tax=Gossypium arboreum TaxID=29729 RepID=A0ABR0QS73_GOSAR|nr:hypothetical protein PVK06_004506 [Gossypium arboreum]
MSEKFININIEDLRACRLVRKQRTLIGVLYYWEQAHRLYASEVLLQAKLNWRTGKGANTKNLGNRSWRMVKQKQVMQRKRVVKMHKFPPQK